MKKNESAGAEDSNAELLKDMFIAMLLLRGVTQDNVAKIVHVSKARVNSIGKNLKVKGSRTEHSS
jgi:DNA-binding XRE family transcriptional regulator